MSTPLQSHLGRSDVCYSHLEACRHRSATDLNEGRHIMALGPPQTEGLQGEGSELGPSR